MDKNANRISSLLVLTPLFGSLIFILLYVAATLLYPGGSQADSNSIGFSWVNNYWCNLLNENAMNGKPNAARPVAMTGMILLGFTIAIFFITFANKINIGKTFGRAMQLSGIICMATAMFIFTPYHDVIINIAGATGAVALFGTLAGLYRKKWRSLFTFGFINVLLVIVNNVVYYSKSLLYCLPVVQKISFLSFLIWICLIDIRLFRKGGLSDEEILK